MMRWKNIKKIVLIKIILCSKIDKVKALLSYCKMKSSIIKTTSFDKLMQLKIKNHFHVLKPSVEEPCVEEPSVEDEPEQITEVVGNVDEDTKKSLEETDPWMAKKLKEDN